MKPRIGLLACALAVVAAACASNGSADDTTTTSTVAETTTTAVVATTTTEAVDDGFPITIDAPNGAVTIDARPERIVSISPTSTEVLFAVGAGDAVVAVDSLSNHPPDAPVTDLSAYTPSVEAIAAYEPDVVFVSYDPADLVAGLDALGIPVILHGTAQSLADAYAQWEQVGAATGHVAEAAALVAGVQADLAAAVAEVPPSAAELSYYYELGPDLYSATSSTFIGELLAGIGMRNIADDADPDGYGYPQLTAEYIVDSDPDLILLADVKCCGQSAAVVGERPGWDTMTAVGSGSVVELDDDIASRWSQRIVSLVEEVVAAVVALEAANA